MWVGVCDFFEVVWRFVVVFLRRLRLVWDDLGEVLICTFEFGCICLKRWFGMQLIFTFGLLLFDWFW